MASKIKYNEKTPSSFIYELYTLKFLDFIYLCDIFYIPFILSSIEIYLNCCLSAWFGDCAAVGAPYGELPNVCEAEG